MKSLIADFFYGVLRFLFLYLQQFDCEDEC